MTPDVPGPTDPSDRTESETVAGGSDAADRIADPAHAHPPIDGTEAIRLAVSAARLGVYSRDLRTGRDHWSPEFLAIFGLGPDEVFAMRDRIPAAVHPEDRAAVLAEAAARLERRASPEFSTEHRIIRADGEVRWVHVMGRLDFDRTGAPLRIHGFVQDVTDRKRAEEALRAQTTLLEAITDHIPVLLCIWDPSLNRFRFNQHARDVLGWTDEDAAQGDFLSKVYPDPDYRESVVEFMLSHEWDWRDLQSTARDGTVIDISWANVQLPDGTSVGIGIDIRRRRAMDEALRQSEGRLAAILSQLPVAAGVLDGNGEFVICNSLMRRFGLERMPSVDSARRPQWRALDDAGRPVPPDQWPGARALRGERVSPGMRFLYTGESEQEVSTLVSAVPFVAPQGEVDGGIIVIQDVSELERAQRERDRFFDLSVDLLAVASTRDGHWKRVNPAFVKSLGWSVDELLAMAFLDLVHPEDLERSSAVTSELAAGTPVNDFEHRVRCKSGEYRWIAWRTAPYAPEGLIYCVGRDITERRAADEALRESERKHRQLAAELEAERMKLAAVIDNLPVGVGTGDTEGSTLSLNKAGLALHGFASEQEMFGRLERYIEEFELLRLDGTPLPTEEWPVSRAMRNEYARGQQVRLRSTISGFERIVSYSVVPVRAAHGGRDLLVYVMQDLTELKQREAELEQATRAAEEQRAAAEAAKRSAETAKGAAEEARGIAEQARHAAEEASRAKDQFIAVLSHELRTPLTPALAAVAAMQNDIRLPADVREDLEMVQRNIGLEVHLINDLLDVSRIISGKLHIERRPMDAAQAIREAAEIVRSDLVAKGQVLEIETPGAPYVTRADAARLQQVFWNLLRNAIKFTPERGRITVTAAAVRGSEVRVQVSDTGIGIPADRIPLLFDAFEQGIEGRSFGGLGLGLAICKALVELHGGAIAGESAGPGKGATFTVRLPLVSAALGEDRGRTGCHPGAPHRQEIGPASEATGAGGAGAAAPIGHGDPAGAAGAAKALRILLVDDHTDTLGLLQRLLTMAGHEVIAASSVARALALAEEARPDFVISDLGLPDGSGTDLLQRLRERGVEIPAIALSGYGARTDIEKSRAAGFSEHLVKPVRFEELLGAVDRHRR